MQILFADDIQADHLERLRHLGHDVVVEPTLTAGDLTDRLTGVDVLVVRSTKVPADAIAAADRLGLIVRAGAGTDNIDQASASDHGVYVCNVPGRNAVAVAELTMGLLLAIDRSIADSVADLRQGTWNKGRYSTADGLFGKTLAIIGLGDIGLAVAERAKAFGLTVVARRRDDRPASVQTRIRSIGVRLVDSDDALLSGADIVSIHVPKSPDTHGLVDAEFLTKLKPGAILLNTSRGDVIDEAALLEALDAGDLRVGLDVWQNEPGSKSGEFTSPLASHPSVIGTHHIGASTDQAQQSVAEGTVEVIEAYLDGDIVNCVNLNTNPTGTTCLTIRHLDRVGVLAQIFAVLRSHGLNVQQMQNQVFAGGKAAVATINVAGGANDTIIEQLCEIDEVLDASLVTDDQHEETRP
ncbi:MAG: NAD(P)-dependent oxidoreductase [Acidimicrobiales bacterium]